MAKSENAVPAWLRPQRSESASRMPAAHATVYLGSDLMQQVADMRNQGVDINVSMVCRQALEAAVKKARKHA